MNEKQAIKEAIKEVKEILKRTFIIHDTRYIEVKMPKGVTLIY